MREVVDSFRPRSPFWTTHRPSSNSVMRYVYDDDLDSLEDLDGEALARWKSVPQGHLDPLRWEEDKSRVLQVSVLQLAQKTATD
jgi:hypothetical protein